MGEGLGARRRKLDAVARRIDRDAVAEQFDRRGAVDRLGAGIAQLSVGHGAALLDAHRGRIPQGGASGQDGGPWARGRRLGRRGACCCGGRSRVEPLGTDAIEFVDGALETAAVALGGGGLIGQAALEFGVALLEVGEGRRRGMGRDRAEQADGDEAELEDGAREGENGCGHRGSPWGIVGCVDRREPVVGRSFARCLPY